MARYPYAAQLAPGGFVIDGKPALTKIDGGLIGDYVIMAVSYTHLRAHETGRNLVCRLLLEKKKKNRKRNATRHIKQCYSTECI